MKKWQYVLIVLIGIWAFGFLVSSIVNSNDNKVLQDQVLVVPIKGVISSSSSSSLFESSGLNLDSTLKSLKKAKEDNTIKAVVLEINSPGGTVIASRELANAVKNLDKPTVAVIREVGASGAYWVASSADVIIADELSITGSIGVISSYVQFSKIMEEYGITYERLTAGSYKDLGSPYKELTQNERNILQSKLNIIQGVFINEVKENRQITDLNRVSTGEFFLGVEAKELGLIDKFGDRDTAIEEAKTLANLKDPRIIEFKEKTSLFNIFSLISKESFYYLGRGIGSEIKLKEDNLQINAL